MAALSSAHDYQLEAAESTCGCRARTTATARRLTAEQVAEYHRHGFVIARKLFTAAESATLLAAASQDSTVADKVMGRNDSKGYVTKLSLMNHCGRNAFGAVARSARMVDNVETLLSGRSHGHEAGTAEEAYMYHSKVMLKEPQVGGAWEWHQDYGYWYNNACMYPRMLSAMVALNEHTEENGCLHVLRGSHSMGRVNHVLTGDQAGADPARTALAKQLFEEVSVLLQPGDVLFFHCNTFHCSRRNASDGPRWSMITAYNTRSNDPKREHQHPCYTPLDRWHDDCVRDLGGVAIGDGDGTLFIDPRKVAKPDDPAVEAGAKN